MNRVIIKLFILGSVACSTAHEPIAVHDFGVPIAEQAYSAIDNIKIDVTAPEWLTDTRVRYRLNYTDKTQIRYYAKDRWVAPPVQLFEQYLLFSQNTQSANKIPYASAQTDHYKTLRAINRLRIHLSDFEQQFDSPENARVLINLFVEVYDTKNNLILKKAMSFEQPSSTPDAKGAIEAFASLMRRAVQQVIQLCLLN